MIPHQIYCDYLEDRGIDCRFLRIIESEGITVSSIGRTQNIFAYDHWRGRGDGDGFGRGNEWWYYGWGDGDGDGFGYSPDGNGYGYGTTDKLWNEHGDGVGDGRYYFSEFTFPNIM